MYNAERILFSPIDGQLVPSPGNGRSYHGQGEVDSILLEAQVRRESEQLAPQITRDILALNASLKNHNPEDFCVDMDLTPETTAIEPMPEEEALPKLRNHQISIRNLGESIPAYMDLAYKRIDALATYREEVARLKRGEPKTPYDQYLMAVDDFGEKDIDQDILDEGRERIVESAIEVNIRLSGDNQSLIEGLQAYNAVNLLTAPSDVEAHYWRYALRFRPKFGQALGTNLGGVDYKFQRKYQDKFWKFYERIEKGGNALWHNWHQRHKEEYNIGLTESYAPHEESHFDVGEVISQEIKRGELNPLAGVITIPGPDGYYFEGIALTAHDWADFELTPDGKLGNAIYRLEKIALVKGFFEVEHGMPPDIAAKDIARYIPLKSLEQIRDLLVEGTTDPFARAYQPVYGRAVLDWEGIFSNLSPEKRKQFIRRATKSPMTRSAVRNLVGEILVD